MACGQVYEGGIFLILIDVGGTSLLSEPQCLVNRADCPASENHRKANILIPAMPSYPPHSALQCLPNPPHSPNVFQPLSFSPAMPSDSSYLPLQFLLTHLTCPCNGFWPYLPSYSNCLLHLRLGNTTFSSSQTYSSPFKSSWSVSGHLTNNSFINLADNHVLYFSGPLCIQLVHSMWFVFLIFFIWHNEN